MNLLKKYCLLIVISMNSGCALVAEVTRDNPTAEIEQKLRFQGISYSRIENINPGIIKTTFTVVDSAGKRKNCYFRASLSK